MTSHIQGSEEWLNERKRHVTASDIPIIMGESLWSTPYQLWERKLGLAPEQEVTPPMQRGIDLEPEAREFFSKKIGIELFQQVIYHQEHEFLMASMDGLSLNGKTGAEFKTPMPGAKSHALALEGKIPPYYKGQLQGQLFCSGLEWLWYFSFDAENNGNSVEIKVYRDEKYIEEMLPKLKNFRRCVETFTPPSFTDKDYDEKSWETYKACVAEIDVELARLKDEREVLKKKMIAEANGRSCRCGGLTLKHGFRKGAVDYKSIPELKKIDLKPYTKDPIETWTLKVNKIEMP